MRVLVTGGAGFLGTNLVRRLLKEGDQEIFVIDDFSTGRYSNLPSGVAVKADSVVNLAKFSTSQLDVIYHLACPASPPAYQKDHVNTLITAFEGTKAALEVARRHECPIVVASTSEVYGDPLEHPQKESYRGNVNTLGPRACYDEGKRAAESLCWAYAKEYGVDVSVVRIHNTYGPFMRPDDGRLVSNFICQAIKGESLTVYGTGEQTRCLCYVDDMIEGLIAAATLRHTDVLTAGAINLGSTEEMTVNEIAAACHSAAGIGELKIEHRPLPVDDPTVRRPDLTRASEILGWKATTSHHDGLKKTAEWFRSALGMEKFQ